MQTATLPQRSRRILTISPTHGPHEALLTRLQDEPSLHIARSQRGQSGLAQAVTATRPEAPRFDAILVDVTLPDGDGITLTTRLRERGVLSPILLLAAPADEWLVVSALDAGANDVIQPTQRPAEVMARLRAQIRAFESSDDAVIDLGAFHFRPARRLLEHRHNGERVRLTEKEAAVLKYLYKADGPVPRTTLLREVWGYRAGATTHTVETHIYRLRRKLEPNPARIDVLVNEEGGYRLRTATPVSRPMPAMQPSADLHAAE